MSILATFNRDLRNELRFGNFVSEINEISARTINRANNIMEEIVAFEAKLYNKVRSF